MVFERAAEVAHPPFLLGLPTACAILHHAAIALKGMLELYKKQAANKGKSPV